MARVPPPYKIIHKFRNANNKYQYLLYVFVGQLHDERVQAALESIKTQGLVEALMRLSRPNLAVLEEYYGKDWYWHFFPAAHVRRALRGPGAADLARRLGEDWAAAHLPPRPAEPPRLPFDEFVRRKHKLLKTMQSGGHASAGAGQPPAGAAEALGGAEDEFSLADLDEELAVQQAAAVQVDVVAEERREAFYLPFRAAKNASYQEEELAAVREKQYVYGMRIYHDDTVEDLREKISVCLQNNPALFEQPLTIPPYAQYLWGRRGKQRFCLTHTYIHEFDPVQELVEPDAPRLYARAEGRFGELFALLNKSGRLISFKNNDATILQELADYFEHGEIFLLDLYSELKPELEALRDSSAFFATYVRYYFPLVGAEHFGQIRQMLADGDTLEFGRIEAQHRAALERRLLTNEIMQSVDRLRFEGLTEKTSLRSEPQKLMHCIVYAYVRGLDRVTNRDRTDLRSGHGASDMYRIFDNFEVDEDYPLVTYQVPNRDVAQKIYNRVADVTLEGVKKWLQSVSFGLVFKVRTAPGKYMTVNLNMNGRLEFKAQWKEEESARLEDVRALYAHVERLFAKINRENTKLQLFVPAEQDYMFSFINVLQEFSIERVDHNKLSDLARYFFPYVTLVVEPKKRRAKREQSSSSKYGTYLRYRRITDYDSVARIERRVLYIIKNYEAREDALVQVIAGEFNLVESQASRIVRDTLAKFPHVKKSRNRLKNLAELTKLKQSGIGIDVQGRSSSQLKIKYTGLRHLFQAADIEAVVRVILYVYDQLYNRKNPRFTRYAEVLRGLTGVARRKRLVVDRVVQEGGPTRARLRFLDEARFRNLEGLDWARACQNSGAIRRQPKQIGGPDQLLRDGYAFNPRSKLYEKQVQVGKRKLTLYAAALESPDGQDLYYTCSPEENNDYFRVGFLTKGVGDRCVPCCFKKHQGDSQNKFKRQHYNKCMNKVMADIYRAQYSVEGLRPNDLYLLQSDRRAHDYKFQLLPYHLDILLNLMTHRKVETRKQYLADAPRGVFLKYGVLRRNSLLQAFSMLYDSNEFTVRERLLAFEDWFLVRNGDLLARYGGLEALREDLRYLENPSIEELHDALCHPGVIAERGVNLYLFRRAGGDYFLRCVNPEDVHQFEDPARDVVLMLEEDGVYYPIVLVHKKRYNIRVERVFRDETGAQLRRLLAPYLQNNCGAATAAALVRHFYPKIIYPDIREAVTGQFLNSRFKCVFLVLEGRFPLPVSEGGAVHGVEVVPDLNPLKRGLAETLADLRGFVARFPQLALEPRALVYNAERDGRYRVYGFQIDEVRVVPVQSGFLTEEEIYAQVPRSLPLRNELIASKIDRQIARRSRVVDERVRAINAYRYRTELYELLRLHLSHFLARYDELRRRVRELIREGAESSKAALRNGVADPTARARARKALKLLLLRALSPKLYGKLAGRAASGEELVVLGDKPTDDYQLSNKRELCELRTEREDCDGSSHCAFHGDRCRLVVSADLLLDGVLRLTEELLVPGIKRNELLSSGEYFVSDIVDQNYYTARANQSIIKRDTARSASLHSEKVLQTIFRTDEDIFDDPAAERGEPHRVFGSTVEQRIVPQSNTVFRAFANGYFWLNSSAATIEERNLGFASRTQANVANYVKSRLIDWLREHDAAELAALLPGYAPEELDLALNKIIMNEAYVSTDLHRIELTLLAEIFQVAVRVLDSRNAEIARYGKHPREVVIKFDVKPDTNRVLNTYAVYTK